MQRQKGFTLIELMIVIAIIAILATLGVTNFSSALRRARDAKRQSDIVAIQKALETCNNIAQGIYIPNPAPSGGLTTWAEIVTYENYAGCYNDAVLNPAIPGRYDYYGYVTAAAPQKFALCAEMENWSGNYTTFTASQTDKYNLGSHAISGNGSGSVGGLAAQVGLATIQSGSLTPCDSVAKPNQCNFFCVFSSQ
jgi:prepilin-type N-terminal cleavage/methylation domain-containing protein